MIIRISNFILLLLLLASCTKDVEYDSIVYRYGSFGNNDYHLNIQKDGTYYLEIGENPMDGDNASPKPGSYSGVLNDTQLRKITKALNKLTSKCYQYNDPQEVLDAAIVELTIIDSQTTRTYRTYNPTRDFEEDIIPVFNAICENTK